MNYTYFKKHYRRFMKATLIGALLSFHTFTIVAMAFEEEPKDEDISQVLLDGTAHDNASDETIEPSMARTASMPIADAIPEEKVEGKNSVLSDVPVCSEGRNKTYMDYRMINEASAQWEIITSMTNSGSDGFLYTDDGYIGVALGSYFGPLGTKYHFTLDNGNVIKAIKVEAKADQDTVNGCHQKYDGSVIEFVIDEENAEKYWGRSENGYINNGNFDNVEDFNGEIVKIEKVQ